MTAPTLPLTCKITTESTVSTANRILEAQFGHGYKQVANDGLNNNVDTWNIHYAPLTGEEKDIIITFINNVGCTVWFTWVPLGEVQTKKWRIKKDSIKRNMLSTEQWKISFTIEQCFDLGT